MVSDDHAAFRRVQPFSQRLILIVARCAVGTG